MKITYNQTSSFDALQKAWKQLCGKVNKSAFGLFEEKSFDDETDVLEVKHPDINSTKPLVRGPIRMQIKGDVMGMAADIDDPTWADVALFFSDYRDERYKRLRDVRLESETRVKKDADDVEEVIKLKVLNLYAAE